MDERDDLTIGEVADYVREHDSVVIDGFVIKYMGSWPVPEWQDEPTT